MTPPKQSAPDLAAYFDEAVRVAITEWSEGAARSIWLPSRRWQRSGNTGSQLVAVVVGGVRGSRRQSGEKMILKLCPPGRFAFETSQHEQAWACDEDFADRYFVRQRFSRYPVGDGRFLMFQEIAGNLSEMRTLRELSDDERPHALGHAINLLLTEWNGALQEPRTTTVATYLRREIGDALDEGRSAHRWAGDAGLVDPISEWIITDEDQQYGPLPNPVRMTKNAAIVGAREIDYLVGHTHGDLHVDNILVPVPKRRQPDVTRMRFIDLSAFDAEAPISRDPVTLILSAVLYAVPRLPEDQADALLSYVISPEAEAPPQLPQVLAETVWSIYWTAETVSGTWRDEWRAQYLLSLQAQALLYTSYDNAQVRGRWWYFRLAARAGLAFLEDHEERPVPVDPHRVEPPGEPAETSAEAPQRRDSDCTREAAPDNLPARFAPVVDRPSLTAQVKHLLARSGHNAGMLGVSLEGTGGFGKTILAQEIGRSREMRSLLPDGVLYVAVGEHTDGAELAGKLNELCEVLAGHRPTLSVPDVAGDMLGKLIGDRSMLLIVDDVWTRSQLAPFLLGAPRCVRLVTTRHRAIMPDRLEPITVGPMGLEEADILLHTGLPELPRHDRDRLLRNTGGWPLLLSLVNRAIHRSVRNGDPVEDAAAEVTRRLEISGPTSVDLSDPGDRANAVGATMLASKSQLHGDDWDRYVELAIFQEDVDIPVDVLAPYWRATHRLRVFETRRLCESLADLSLLIFDSASPVTTVRLHDVVRAYLRKECGAVGVRMLNSMFLDAVRPDTSEQHQWWSVPAQNTYLWRHLTYHLVEAHRLTELEALLADFRYIAAKLSILGPVPVEADLALASSPHAGRLLSGLQRSAHLLAPTVPNRAVVDILLSRLDNSAVPPEMISLYHQTAPGWRISAVRPMPDALHPAVHRRIHGHPAPVGRCAISPDGSLLLTASDDGTLGMWEFRTGRRVGTLRGHDGPVLDCTIGSDGTWAVSGGDDTTVRLWNLSTREPLAVLRGHTAVVRRCSVAPDGTWVVSASDDQTARVWDTASGTVLAILEGHKGTVRGCAVGGGGRLVATAGGDGTVRLWATETWSQIHVFEGHTGAVRGCAITTDGKLLASAGGDGTVRLWDAEQGILRAVLEGHNGSVRACGFSMNETYVASAGGDGTVRLWETATGRLHTILNGHSGAVRSCTFSTDGAWLITGSEDRIILTWDMSRATAQPTLDERTRSAVRACAAPPDDDWLVAGGNDHTVRIWETSTGRLRAVMVGHGGTVRTCAVSTDARLIASGADDRTVKIWEAETGQLVATLDGGTSAVRGCAFSPDGAWLVSGSADGMVRMWDIATRRVLRQFGHPGPAIWACAVSPDGMWVATAGDDRVLRIWDATTGALRGELSGHTSAIWACPVAPDGTWLATVGNDHTLRVWSGELNGEHTVYEGHSAWLTSCCVSPDGRWLASAGYDRTVRVWPADEAFQGKVLTGHSSIVWAVASGGSGRWLASGGDDETIRIWDSSSWTCHAVIDVNPTALRSCVSAPDGAIVLAVGGGGQIWRIDADTGARETTVTGPVGYNCCAVTPDGSLFVGGDDGAIRVWHPRTDAIIDLGMSHLGRCSDCAIAPDGSWLVTAGGGVMHIWDLRSYLLKTVLRENVGSIHGCAVSPDGTWLVTAGDDGVCVWSMPDGRQRLLLRADGAALRARCCAVASDGSWFAAAGDDSVVRLWQPDDGRMIAALNHFGTPILSCSISDDGRLLATVTETMTIHVWDLADLGECAAMMRVIQPIRHCEWIHGTHRLCVVGDVGAYLFDVIK